MQAPVMLDAEYFDGHSARARRVSLHIAGHTLHIVGDGLDLAVPVADVDWPERRSSGVRMAHLAGGGSLHCQDGAAWDAWARAEGLRDPVVVRMQQSWRLAVAAGVALLVVTVGLYRWGVPVASRAIVALTPPEVDAAVGGVVLDALRDHGIIEPTAIEYEQQEEIRVAFARAFARTRPSGDQAPVALRFYDSELGANALALPGGTIIVTDDMVRLLADREDVLLGVLAHEAGHVRGRHGMKSLVQTAFIGTLAGVAIGDYSVMLATVPAALGQMAYSRQFERDADGESIRLLRANGISPAVMVTLFERLQAARGRPPAGGLRASLGIAFASHPADEERLRRFEQAAGVRATAR